ncbi:TPA: hypothetical protein ACQJXC_003356 [Raoultella ornithinolytica]
MGSVLTAKTLNAAGWGMGYSAAVPSGLQYMGIYSDANSLKKNQAGVGRIAVVGSPVVGDITTGATFSNNTNYLDKVMDETDSFTLMSIFHMPTVSAQTPAYAISNSRSNPTLVSYTLGAANTTAARLFYGYGTAGAFLSLDIAATGLVSIIARVRTTGFSPGDIIAEIRNCTAGTSAKLAAVSNMGAHVKAGPFRVGSGYSAANSNAINELASMTWDRYLTDDEVLAQYQQLKELYSTYGVSV